MQFNENGRGGQHPSYVLGYYDAPSIESAVHEQTVRLNPKESFGFNTASLAHVVLYRVGTWGQLDRTMVLYGTCMGSASSHSNVNLPALLAGGGFKHGQRLGIETGGFSTAMGTMKGVEMA